MTRASLAPSPLAPEQLKLLRLLAKHHSAGSRPTPAALAGELGLAGESSVTPQLQALVRKGYLSVESRGRGRARDIRLTIRACDELKCSLTSFSYWPGCA